MIDNDHIRVDDVIAKNLKIGHAHRIIDETKTATTATEACLLYRHSRRLCFRPDRALGPRHIGPVPHDAHARNTSRCINSKIRPSVQQIWLVIDEVVPPQFLAIGNRKQRLIHVIKSRGRP